MHQHFLLRYIVCVEVFDLEVIDGDWCIQRNMFRLFNGACRSVLQPDFIADFQVVSVGPAMSFHVEWMLVGGLDGFSVDR